jgi:hypothetical protein
MNKTIKEHLVTFTKWIFNSLLVLSGLANLGFWFYVGKAFWYHSSSYLWIALWWLVATVPSAIQRVYLVSRSRSLSFLK